MNQRHEYPCFTPTMMAAVPYRDMDRAVDIILKCFPEAPCLPVMTRSVRWLLEGIPCLVMDRERRIIYFDLSTEREPEILEFYDRYEAQDLDHFATTVDTAPFFYRMMERIAAQRPENLKWVAFHTAGPILLGDTLKQADGTPAIHNETLRDILIKGMNMKARWLETKIRSVIPDVRIIADLPETTLVNFTSSGGTGSREEIIEAVNLSFTGLESLTWVHCCANIDWSLRLSFTRNSNACVLFTILIVRPCSASTHTEVSSNTDSEFSVTLFSDIFEPLCVPQIRFIASLHGLFINVNCSEKICELFQLRSEDF
ncbi:MAG: hypothetical protein ACLFUL_17640, partial [Desulfobacteraceae bacterium]